MITAEAADFGIKAIMSIGSGVIEEANINAANTVARANAAASNLVRGASNELRSKQASLSRYAQSVNNQRVLSNTASSAEVALTNYRRSRDSALQDSFEQQISFAEQAGAQAAASAFSGLSGGVADIVRGTTALRRQRIQQRVETAQKQGAYDAATNQRNIIMAGLDNLDQSSVMDGLDYGNDIATTKHYSGSLLGDIIRAKTGTNLANVADTAKGFFKQPNNPIGPSGIPYGTES